MVIIIIVITLLEQEGVYLAVLKSVLCKYQRILSGVTNHLHDHEFLLLTYVMTSDELCSHHTHVPRPTHTHCDHSVLPPTATPLITVMVIRSFYMSSVSYGSVAGWFTLCSV